MCSPTRWCVPINVPCRVALLLSLGLLIGGGDIALTRFTLSLHLLLSRLCFTFQLTGVDVSFPLFSFAAFRNAISYINMCLFHLLSSLSRVTACRRFTPVLKDLYQKLKAREDVEDFELVFCSMDKTDAEYKSYTSDMPWYCLPHTSPVMGKLANQYGAQGIPHLVVLDKDGTVLQQDGVGEVSIDPEGSDFPWRPKPLVDLLPKEYLTTDNQRRPMSELDDKYLMLYMSAHWCPPCQSFSPKLSKAYTALKKSRDDFEVRCVCLFVRSLFVLYVAFVDVSRIIMLLLCS
jgi:thiol-disulfide isomerase/thioredoxin